MFYRMKFLVKKWRRATRVGSEVVGGSVDQSNGKLHTLFRASKISTNYLIAAMI